jgi:hypothetical protein
MSNLQAFLLGIMVAFAPSAIVFAFLVWRAQKVWSGHFDEQDWRCDELKHELPVIPGDQQKNLIPEIDDHELSRPPR